MLPQRAEALGKVEQEIQQERAAALGRIARTLESLLARLEMLRHRAQAASGADREAAIAEHGEVRHREAFPAGGFEHRQVQAHEGWAESAEAAAGCRQKNA